MTIMGEFSKYVGEVGEDIVNDFLTLFGWRNMCNNKKVDCCVSIHEKITHGVDALYVYDSLLQKQTLVSVVVSAKYSASSYTSVKSTFRDHFKDIANTIECYNKSQLKRNITKNYKGSSRKEDIGVLFYLNNDENEEKDNIKGTIANTRIESTLKFNTIHVIDNARAKFLFESLNFIRKKYKDCDFFCNNTTLNIASSKTHTKIMPVEYITSPIIPISVASENGRRFILLCDFDFSKESLILVFNLARKLCSDFSSHYEIYFRQYNALTDDPIIDEVKMSQINEDDDIIESIDVQISSYNSNFRNIKNEK